VDSRELKIRIGCYSDVVNFLDNYFKIANKEQALSLLRKTEREAGEEIEWFAVGGECRICKSTMFYFVAEDSDSNNLECNVCGNMSVDPKEIEDDHEED